MKSRKKRSLVIGILCCLLVFMGAGFAIMNATLNIEGTATTTNTWSVLIDNISVVNASEGVTNNEEETKILEGGVKANLKVDFIKPGDFIEYKVEVVNKGSIDATLSSIVVTPKGDDVELFTFTNNAVQGEKLVANSRTSFIVRIDYKKEATRIPEGEVTFELVLNYVQGDGSGNGGSTPGGGTEPENDWLFEVDENGEVVAYNYNSSLTETPQNIVVPAEVNGIPVTTITEQSFMLKGNLELYLSEAPMGMYGIIHESEPNFTYVKDKILPMFLMECGGDSACEEQYKQMMYVCKDKNSCYNIANMEQHEADSSVELAVTSIPEGAVSQGGAYVVPDPNVPLEESMKDLKPSIETLDLSKATNLTTIEDYALSGAGLKSIEFGENSNITKIAGYAFANNELTNVVIPDSVETIENGAFEGNQIETLTIGTTSSVQNQLNNNKYSVSKLGATVNKLATSNSKLKSIGFWAFRNNKIQVLNLPSGVESIDYSAFENNAIVELKLPDSLKSIGNSAFSGNQINGELVIPSNVTSIGEKAFYNNQIGIMTFPKSVTELGIDAFASNPLESLTIEKCTTSICVNRAGNIGTVYTTTKFFGDNIKNLIIESGEIGVGAFYTNSTTKIQNLTLGEGVTSIGEGAFEKNTITELILPSKLTTIGDYAFFKNQISGTLTIPASVETIGLEAFSSNPIETLTIEKCTLNLCVGYDESTSAQWISSIPNVTINSGQIGKQTFSGKKIQNLTLGEGVTSIGEEAFLNNSISNLVIPSSVEFIGKDAFYYQRAQTGGYVLKSIIVKRTEEDFLANVTLGGDWYCLLSKPTITYNPS